MRRHKSNHPRAAVQIKEKAKCNKVHVSPWRCQCGYENVVSWWFPVCVTMATMLVRISYVMSPRSLWILHPDEIYQSIEVSFSQVYGYGFRPYEYLPPPGTNSSNPFMKHTLKTGLYALRSFIYPNTFAAVLQVFKMIGLDSNPFMICRVFNVIVTSTLPMSVFYFTIKAFNCRLLGFLTCAITASDLHIAVYSTHAVINGFIAPLLFFGLALCLDDSTDTSSYSNNNIDNKPTRTTCSDQNENTVKHNDDLKYLANGTGSYRAPVVGIDNGFDDHVNNNRGYEHTFKPGRNCRSFVGGLVVGVTCYVRFDTVLFSAVVLLLFWLVKDVRPRDKTIHVTTILCGFVIAVMISALEDIRHYGLGTFSPIQWFKFNVLSDRAKFIFENPDAQGYVGIFCTDIFNTAVLILSSLVFLYVFFKRILASRNKECAVILSFAVLLVIYSIVGHKDARFLFNVYVLYGIIISCALHSLVHILDRLIRDKIYVMAFTYVFLSLFTCNNYLQFPTSETASASGWTYGKAKHSRDMNTCLDHLGHLSDVTGVLVNGSVYDMGGYSILKHNVPMLVKIHFEFNLYEAHNDNIFGKGSSVKILNDFQDFFDQSNLQYILTLFRRDPRFNYVISSSAFKNLYGNLKFKRTFVCGRFSIFRRETRLTERDENKLHKLSVGTNATVLEHEASWLFTHALYEKAIERIERLMELDRSRVRPFQLIMACYERLKLWEKAISAQNECYREHGREKCKTQQERVVLHEEYRRFN